MKKTKEKRFYTAFSLAFIMLLAMFSPVYGASYADIHGHWSEGYVLRATELGWIKGYEDNTLRPDKPISISEFITLAHRLGGLSDVQAKEISRFKDLNDEAWSKETIAESEASGLLDVAFLGDRIHAKRAITREEAAQILKHSLHLHDAKKKNGTLDQDVLLSIRDMMAQQSEAAADVSRLSFTDSRAVTPRFVFAIQQLNADKVLTGYADNRFKPQGNLTRAEAMTMLIRATKETPAVIKRPSLANVKLTQEGDKFYLIDQQNGMPLLAKHVPGGAAKVGDTTYLLNADGSLKSDFYHKDNKVYYIDKEKGMIRGWKQIGKDLYYFSPANNRMYRNGMFSTGEGVYWFGADGKLKTGSRPGGVRGRRVKWVGPTAKELENGWLKGADADLRFRGQEIANYAASFEGLPFKWYGTDLTDGTGVYCVGNTYSAHKAFGITIPGPKDCNVKLHKGYELTRCQYEAAYKFGGMRYPASFDTAWPGDIIFNYSPNFYLGYNHAGIYMGKNGGRPIYIHATLKDGLFIGDCREMNWTIGRRFNKEFVRYNTRQNTGNGIIPDMPRNR